MVYEFRVVACFDCKFYQVDQVKKHSNKWICKLCGQKQSLKQTFFQGSSKECRQHVQRLNKECGNKDFIATSQVNHVPKGVKPLSNNLQRNTYQDASSNISHSYTGSKWNAFLDEPDNKNGENKGAEANTESLTSWVPPWYPKKLKSNKLVNKARYKDAASHPYDRRIKMKASDGTALGKECTSLPSNRRNVLSTATKLPFWDENDDDLMIFKENSNVCLTVHKQNLETRSNHVQIATNIEKSAVTGSFSPSSKWGRFLEEDVSD